MFVVSCFRHCEHGVILRINIRKSLMSVRLYSVVSATVNMGIFARHIYTSRVKHGQTLSI